MMIKFVEDGRPKLGRCWFVVWTEQPLPVDSPAQVETELLGSSIHEE